MRTGNEGERKENRGFGRVQGLNVQMCGRGGTELTRWTWRSVWRWTGVRILKSVELHTKEIKEKQSVGS